MIHNIENEYLSISVSSEGAELLSAKTPDGTEYIWQRNPNYWSSSAINLFPIAGRLYGGEYTHENNVYSMDIHGFIKDTILSAQKNKYGIEFTCQSNEYTYSIYPFNFVYGVTYILNSNCIAITYNVINIGDKPMYFSVGAHPGFNIPEMREWYLQFDNGCNPKEVLLKEGFITGEYRDYSLYQNKYIMLDESMHNKLPDTLLLKNMSSGITLKSHATGKSVRVYYPDMKYLALWKAKSEAEYICIEPWSGIPSVYGKTDELSQKIDIITLNANQKYTNSIYITIN